MNFLVSLLACSTCANSFQEAGGNAAGWSILFLLAVIVPLATSAVFFVVRIAKREKVALDPCYQDELGT